MKLPAEIYDALHETNPGTWVTHYGQALGFFLLGAIRSFDLGAGLVAGAFGHREISGFAKAVRQHGFRWAIRHKLLDGIGDALFAVLGLCTGLVWHVGGPLSALGSFAGSSVVWWIMQKADQRRTKQ